MINSNQCVAILMKLAEDGRLSKTTLSDSLSNDARGVFLEKCADIERRFTEACRAKNDPCLESGCAMDGEVCLSALLNNETEYQKACGAEWIALLAKPENRLFVWQS